jgi:selenobiotic family peptide radical SAM maturase
MKTRHKAAPAKLFPVCRALVGPRAWPRLLKACGGMDKPASLPDRFAAMKNGAPDFLPELARLEWTRHEVSNAPTPAANESGRFEINPTLDLLPLTWRLCRLVSPAGDSAPSAPQPGAEHAMAWRDPATGATRVQAAENADLLALKVVVEKIPLAKAAKAAKSTVPLVENALWAAAEKGILLAPRTRIRRDPALFPIPAETPAAFVASPMFLIQWHITQACDLRCKHCYDRSRRSPLTLKQGVKVLDGLRDFCLDRRVRGAVCFTGGNPFLYPDFGGLWSAAAERGFPASILGNPVPRAALEKLLPVQRPQYYQVSLEGLPEYNDSIRGAGHFARTIEFFGVLRDLEVESSVMLTLTRDNLEQVLPLAERLRGHTRRFSFNRLSQVGEGAALPLPTRAAYAAFLETYLKAADSNPMLTLKDNLFNIARQRRGEPPFDGCTGFGCGAAFNFVAVLPDGEVHACRKFPSPIGSLLRQDLGEIYESPAARRYRAGCRACAGCALRPTCGGCMASAFGRGLNVFEERDPFCFVGEPHPEGTSHNRNLARNCRSASA